MHEHGVARVDRAEGPIEADHVGLVERDESDRLQAVGLDHHGAGLEGIAQGAGELDRAVGLDGEAKAEVAVGQRVLVPRGNRAELEPLDEQEVRGEAKILSLAPHAGELSPGEHRREHARFGVDLDVTVGSDHNFYAGFAENLSAGGVFIATHKLKPVGSPIELSINLPDGVTIRARGEVRWIRVFNEQSDTPPGMGVKFLEIDQPSVSAIGEFLARRDPLFFDDE